MMVMSDRLGDLSVALRTPVADERIRVGASSVPPALLARIVAYFHPLRVVLFGSAARGEGGPDSDLDLLVILDDDAPDNHLTLRAGWESRRGYNDPVDIVPVREAVYRRRASIPGTLAYEAEIDGVLVYERP
jgi:predicted nucleotidyltransferase